MMRGLRPLIALLLCISPAFAEKAARDDALEKKFEQLLKSDPGVRRKIENGQATKADVLEWLRKGGDRNGGKKRTGKKEYYRKRVDVKDPAEFSKTGEAAIFSGPQPGETLPPLKVIGMRGELKGKEHDPIELASGKPLVLIFQNNSVVGQKGLLLMGPALERIAEMSPNGLYVSTTFLVDDPAPRSVFKYDFMDKIADVIRMSISSTGRDGPGVYGLNRNVAMTIIVAKDQRVLHNFALTQPMLYPDPHVMGAVAEAIGVERQIVSGWLNRTARAAAPMQSAELLAPERNMDARRVALRKRLEGLIKEGKLTGKEAGDLYRIAFPKNVRSDREGR